MFASLNSQPPKKMALTDLLKPTSEKETARSRQESARKPRFLPDSPRSSRVGTQALRTKTPDLDVASHSDQHFSSSSSDQQTPRKDASVKLDALESKREQPSQSQDFEFDLPTKQSKQPMSPQLQKQASNIWSVDDNEHLFEAKNPFQPSTPSKSPSQTQQL